MFVRNNTKRYAQRLLKAPDAVARMKGAPAYSAIAGTVSFYKTMRGILVTAEISGLPQTAGNCSGAFYGFHIHEGNSCAGNAEDAFADSKGHYNPDNCSHPFHAGDLPPLLGNGGYAWSTVLTDRFTLTQVLGRTVIIHRRPDDFTTQPSGNSGEKIACGLIELA